MGGNKKSSSWEHLHREMIREKWSFIMCQFLYTCLAFFFIFSWFYVCFSVLKSIWKKAEERSSNGAKQAKLAFF